jgi:hypothetical protein
VIDLPRERRSTAAIPGNVHDNELGGPLTTITALIEASDRNHRDSAEILCERRTVSRWQTNDCLMASLLLCIGRGRFLEANQPPSLMSPQRRD